MSKEQYSNVIDLAQLAENVAYKPADDNSYIEFFVDTHRPLNSAEATIVHNHMSSYPCLISPPHQFWAKEGINTKKPTFRNFWRCKCLSK